jgi:hypothetical protein
MRPLELNLDQALDFEHTPICEGVPPCDKNATWLAVSACGHGEAYCCEDHRAAFIIWLDTYVHECCTCHKRDIPVTWNPIR